MREETLTIMQTEQFYYDNKIVKKFVNATMFWGIIGMSIGLLLAFMFLFPNVTDGISWLSFGRLRPLHTNAVIFAFVGNAIFAGVYYSSQRLLKARMWKDWLSNLNFWGWQAIIVSAALTLLTKVHVPRLTMAILPFKSVALIRASQPS